MENGKDLEADPGKAHNRGDGDQRDAKEIIRDTRGCRAEIQRLGENRGHIRDVVEPQIFVE